MSKIKQMSSRNGLSIIEVLTSIVVAMIGVFGVMILIPFAVKQAQTGLDSDAGVQVARNAYSQFEIEGFRNPNNWMINNTTPYDPFAGTDSPTVFSIDPLGIRENGNAFAMFPISRNDLRATTPTAPFDPVDIESVNLRIPSTTATPRSMEVEHARRMFRSTDDLVFGDSLDDLLGPEQLFDSDGTNNLRRQSLGRISWSAIVVPFKNKTLGVSSSDRWSYKMYILVYKDRKTLVSDPDGAMAIAKLDVNDMSRIGPKSPVGNVYFDDNVTVEGSINRDDWVMLINRSLNNSGEDGVPPPGVTYAEKGFDRQLAFYRVVNFSDNIGTTTASSLTLDGPDFDFGDPDGVDTTGTVDPGGLIQDTYIVHLQDVIGVYERTFEPEGPSNWNVSF